MRRDLANALLNDAQVSAETLGAHTFGETGEDANFLFDLLLTHKCPTPGDAVEISLFDEIKDGLTNGCEADFEASCIFALLQEDLTRQQFPALYAAQQVVAHLMVQWNRRLPIQRTGFPRK